jgi:enoyl-CoA hydratase/carnithine racemase
MEQTVQTSTSEGVLTIVLNRPDKKNALTSEMYETIASALAAADEDPEVRAVLLRSVGDIFSAGNDISQFEDLQNDDQGQAPVWKFLLALAGFSKPLVAAVHGRAIGVGTTMLLHCDQVVMADDAILRTPFTDLAVCPEAASSLLLPQAIGHVRAFSAFALGKAISAQEALAWGLASEVAPPDGLIAAADAVAAALARRPTEALRATKRLMRDTPAILERMEAERQEFMRLLRAPEARAIFQAFLSKR